jgi:hypothetical protein
MNKPERLPHPDFTHWFLASLRDLADDQKAIPRIAKDAALMREQKMGSAIEFCG